MTKSELKSLALDSMNAAGAAMQQGNFTEAKSQAEKAWECYYELQKQRGEDEDFTDLIYWARGLYQQAEDALQQQQPEQPQEGPDDNYDLEEEYKRISKRVLGGFAGNPAAAVEAAAWYIDPNHWMLLINHGKVSFLEDAAKLIEKVLNNTEAPLRDRALAANLGAKMYSTPIYSNIDIHNAIKYAKYAALLVEKGVDLTQEEKYDILTTAMEILLCRGEVELSGHLCEVGIKAGLDKGIFYPLCRYGYRHDEKMASELEKVMYEAGVWQGMFLHGQTLAYDWIDDYDNDELLQAMWEFNRDVLSALIDERDGSPVGNAITGLCCYITALYMGVLDFLQNDMRKMIETAASENSDWANFYYGEILSIAASIIENEDPEDERVSTFRKSAWAYYACGADLGHKGCIKCCINMIREGQGDPEKLDYYLNLASELDVELPAPEPDDLPDDDGRFDAYA